MQPTKKFEGMLFCTDLDGTLFASDGSVSKQNLDAIEYFKSEGGLFTFVTGRVPQTAHRICEIVKPNAPYGCVNGAGIYSPGEDRYLWRTFLPKGFLELVQAVDRQLPDVGYQFNTEKGIYFIKDNSTMQGFRKATGVPNLTCREDEIEEQVLKVVFGHREDARIAALADLLRCHPRADEFDFICSERTLYEILPKGVSKGRVLCKMAELLGIDIRKTIAVGDYHNDVSMLKAAGISFAVANAVDAAKAVADHVTVSHDESAIAVIIDQLDRGILSC